MTHYRTVTDRTLDAYARWSRFERRCMRLVPEFLAAMTTRGGFPTGMIISRDTEQADLPAEPDDVWRGSRNVSTPHVGVVDRKATLHMGFTIVVQLPDQGATLLRHFCVAFGAITSAKRSLSYRGMRTDPSRLFTWATDATADTFEEFCAALSNEISAANEASYLADVLPADS